MTHEQLDLVGHFAYASLALGQVMLGRYHESGWLFRCAGTAIWMVLGVALGLSSVAVWSAVFLVVDFYGWRRWRRA